MTMPEDNGGITCAIFPVTVIIIVGSTIGSTSSAVMTAIAMTILMIRLIHGLISSPPGEPWEIGRCGVYDPKMPI